MSKTTRFKERSPEATVNPGFRLETGRFKMRHFEKAIEKSSAINKTKWKFPSQTASMAQREASCPA